MGIECECELGAAYASGYVFCVRRAGLACVVWCWCWYCCAPSACFCGALMSGKGARACAADGPSRGDARREEAARGAGMTSSAGTFSPRVRLSFASRFLLVSVTVGVAGVPGVVGVTGIGVRLPLPLRDPEPALLVSVAAESGGERRGSDGGRATAFKRRTRGVGRGARLLLLLPPPLDFSRTWRAKVRGVGRDWMDASELLE